jgi:hypothetical protein
MGFSSGSSQSSGSSYGYNTSLAQSMQNVWGPQAGPLAAMFQSAQGLQQQQQNAVPAAARSWMQRVMPFAMGGLQNMQQYAQPNSALLKRQTADLANVVGTEFGRTILPQLRTGGIAAGGLGSSRDKIGQGIAAGDAASAISRGATDLFANAWNTGANVAGQLPALAGQVANLGMMPFQAAWAPFTSLAGILGGPTTLSRSQAMSQGEQSSQQVGSSRQFGFNLW